MPVHRQPLYLQVAREIEESIRQGRWAKGEPLPAETELARSFGVSVSTIRKALDGLVVQNHLERRQGVGTFVTSYAERGYWNRFQRYQTTDGRIPRWKDELVSCEPRPATENVARALRTTAGVPIVRVERRMALEGRHCGVDIVWLSPEHFRNVTARDFETREPGSLYAFFEKTYGVVITDVRDAIVVRNVTREEADAYGLPFGAPHFVLTRTGYTFGRTPVEYRLEHVLPENIQIVLE